MEPVLGVDEMREADARFVRAVGIDRLIDRAGYAAAAVARRLLGGSYGRRVVVFAGKGHNGDDGRVCAHYLRRRGADVAVLPAGAPGALGAVDLVVDAAFGTGFRGRYDAPPAPAGAKVLALDLPSGLDADTGLAPASAVVADSTVTFGAYKRGLFLGEGPRHAGRVVLDTIGFSIDEADAWLVGDRDLEGALPERGSGAHKWQRAVLVLAGSPGMTGAARLVALGALRSGASMVRVGAPGAAARDIGVTEAVSVSLPATGTYEAIASDLGRAGALVIGPGLGIAPEVAEEVRELVARVRDVPMVIDADGLSALGEIRTGSGLFAHNGRVVLTPHAGEFARLAGRAPDPDRIGAARELARRTGATVLLKGPVTVVAPPAGPVRLVTSGSSRLATAGTGDVLSGLIGALLASGLDALSAASFGAHLHGRAAGRAPDGGLVASDLPGLIAAAIDGYRRGPDTPGRGRTGR